MTITLALSPTPAPTITRGMKARGGMHLRKLIQGWKNLRKGSYHPIRKDTGSAATKAREKPVSTRPTE